jgi:phenylalanyl-tRNA synthetase beta chain
MNFFKKLFQPNTSCKSCSCCCGKKLLSDVDALILKNADEKIVVGKILAIASHPDESVTKVRVTQTEVAPGVVEQILCGGVNIEEGVYVPVATVGAKLSEDFEIGERKIRGELSRGMICSREELGLSKNDEPDHGIWILGENFADKLGAPMNTIS